VGTSTPGAAFWGRQIEVGMLCINYEMSNISDANNYDLQNVECQSLVPSCEISSRSPRFAKRAVANLSDILRRSFCLQQSRIWVDSALRHNACR